MKSTLHNNLMNATLAGLLFAGLPASLCAQSNYNSFELQREDNWGPMQLEDMNGDGRQDILVPALNPALGRELHIYHQLSDGNFSAEPQRIEIKSEIVAIATADLRSDPGSELVLFANQGVFSLSTATEGYAGNLKPLAQWELLAGVPDAEAVRFTNLVTDLNQDGTVDLLLPGDDQYGIFLGEGNEAFSLTGTFSTLNPGMTPIQRRNFETDFDAELGINAEQGIIIELTVDTPTPFDGFVEKWQAENDSSRSLLNSEQWMPAAQLGKLDADDLPDISYINAGENGQGQFNAHYQRPNGEYSATPDWSVTFDSRGELDLLDMNNDGLDDLLRLDGNGDDWTARLFINRGGTFDFTTPDQVMRFSGYDVQLDLITLQADSDPVLSVNYYTIPVVDAIRNASINRVQLLYAPAATNDGRVFSNRPASRLEESFSADNVRGLAEQMSLSYDVDGDGRKDALYITANGTLAAKRIGNDLQIASDPFWEYVSPRSVFEFRVLQLNDDEHPDLFLRHGSTSTFLVAQP